MSYPSGMRIPGKARCICFLDKYIHNAKPGKFNRKQYILRTFERSKFRTSKTARPDFWGRPIMSVCRKYSYEMTRRAFLWGTGIFITRQNSSGPPGGKLPPGCPKLPASPNCFAGNGRVNLSHTQIRRGRYVAYFPNPAGPGTK